jgi:hypothetical protein
MTGPQLAKIIRNEVNMMIDTEHRMEGQRLGWRPNRYEQARMDAIATATHQFKFSLLAIAQELDKIE